MLKLSTYLWGRQMNHATDVRVVYTNNGPDYLIPEEDLHRKFCKNAIISSRYTWYNFVPKNLFEQFHNLANVFFALIAIMYVYSNPATSIWSNLGPLISIVTLILIKDGIEDIMRHRRDRSLNHVPVDVLQLDFIQDQTAQWTTKKAQNLQVGDVIRCYRGQAFPCDIVLLASSNPSSEVNVTTANLDGETNIKKYFAVAKTQNTYLRVTDEDWLFKQTGQAFDVLAKQLFVKIECQPPCADLTRFEGRMSCDAWAPGTADQVGDRRSEREIPLGFSNLALRGAKLANTDFVIGVVVYTGKETKLSLNSKQAKRKYSSREARSNVILLSFILGMITISLLLAIVDTVWTTQNRGQMWYLPTRRQTSWGFVRGLFRFITIVNFLIPISIIFTIEFQQMYIAFTISSDMQMYDPGEDLCGRANSAQVADELGQVNFLFSDKTGTLTQNVMQLCTCAVITSDGSTEVYEFGSDSSEQKRPWSLGDTQGLMRLESDFQPYLSDEDEDSDEDSGDGPRDYKSCVINGDEFHLCRRAQRQYHLTPYLEPKSPLEQILTRFTLCHTVETGDNVNDENLKPKYEASSPDEKALVEGAAEQGVVFLRSQPIEGQVNAKTYHVEYRYPKDTGNSPAERSTSSETGYTELPQSVKQVQFIVDAVLPFDSTRKRMSVMVRHPDGTYHIHSKGAETVMLEAENCTQSSSAIRTEALKIANQFALEGLRTLVFGTRQLNRAQYENLLVELRRTEGLVGEQRVQGMKQIYSRIESDLVPCAVTGVEDKLQIGVKECVQSLRESGIQIWVLTGDKEETAVTVSQAAGHFTPKMTLIRLTHCENFETTACRIFEQIDGLQSRAEQRLSRRSHTQSTLVLTNPSPRQLITPTLEEVGEVVLASDEYNENGGNRDAKTPTNKRRYLANRLMGFVRDKQWSRLRIPRRRHAHRPGVAGEPIGLVIDGKTLTFALQPSLRDAFLDLCMNVTTVLCCRMTPLQKASIVQLVQAGLSKSSPGGSVPVIAAVGDGGNDVAMLLQANIGVGIYGKEGREAARAGDYSLPGFRFLHRLFVLHGHWAYHRLSITMNLFYFKCTALVTTELLLQFYSGFSQNANYGGMMFALYNLTMTSVACLFFGMFEKHLPERELILRPYLYRVISRQANLRAWYVILWIVEGVWFGAITFLFSTYGLGGGMYHAPAAFMEPGIPSRYAYDFAMVGMANYIFLWIAVNVRIAIASRDLNYMILVGFLVTCLNIAILFLYQVTCGYTDLSFLIVTKLARSPAFWLGLMLSVLTASISSLVWRLLSDTWWTGQMHLSEITHQKLRKKKRRSLRFWITSLVSGQRDNRYMDKN
ncbi:Phospholipid-transporting ATPase [Fasciolopsis buskii]|uniref:Phospholipid-transporting ATPase n=1 Tax=Fasciolopsis buskii TaxID=27845 RepID=A0A8E0VE76_9TREM|nr:Phospholipid-transporting ATPase [Fasciolopsis buski]